MAGVAPAGAAYVARLVVDHVIAAAAGDDGARSLALLAIGIEAVLVGVALAAGRGILFSQTLLRAKLAHALRDPFWKRRSRSTSPASKTRPNTTAWKRRREAAVRPLGVVSRVFSLIRYGVALFAYTGLLAQLSPWAVLALLIAGVPAFVAEARSHRRRSVFSGATRPKTASATTSRHC